jgi:sugar/nucleoside kinase (ribokinase family)
VPGEAVIAVDNVRVMRCPLAPSTLSAEEEPMPEVLTAGEVLVEIMRKDLDVPLGVPGGFFGPFPSGAPAIFIDQVACLGHTAAIVGSVGKDEFGDAVAKRLDIDGVDVSYLRALEDRVTAVAFVSYRKNGSRKFIYHIPHTAAGHVRIPSGDRLEGVKLFHVMGCSLMVNAEMRSVINGIARVVKKNGGLVSFDPNIRVELLGSERLEDVIGTVFGTCDILLPGEKELLDITGKPSAKGAVKGILGRGVKAVVIKRGKEGARFVDGSRDIRVDAIPVSEVDPTGAGDAFDAGFLCGYLEGLPPEKCLALASACGALNASHFGPMEGVFPRSFVERFLRKSR